MNATQSVKAAPKPNGKRGPRGGVYDPFPIKLHRMLDECKAAGLESVVSWLEHGRAFRIHQPKLFAATIMCRFFNQSKYTSFQRQLNLYGECIFCASNFYLTKATQSDCSYNLTQLLSLTYLRILSMHSRTR